MRAATVIKVPTQSKKIPAEVLPLVAAFLAISFAFGVLARESGVGMVPALLMSLVVYAGTAQVVALGMISAFQPIWVVVVVTLLINSRFLLMSSILVEPVRKWKPLSRFLFAAQVTDETFALLLPWTNKEGEFAHKAHWIQGGAYVAWGVGTVLGFLLPMDSAMLTRLGLDFALGAMMLSVLALQVSDYRGIVVAGVAAAVSLLAAAFGIGWMTTLLAAAIAPAVGVWLEKKR